MRFDTKIAVVVLDDLLMWQKLNVTAFTVSGLATLQGLIGEPYVDGSGRSYLPMIRQPIMVFSADRQRIRSAFDNAVVTGVALSIYTSDLFETSHDEANRAAVRAVETARLDVVGLAILGQRKAVDRIVRGIELHR